MQNIFGALSGGNDQLFNDAMAEEILLGMLHRRRKDSRTAEIYGERAGPRILLKHSLLKY